MQMHYSQDEFLDLLVDGLGAAATGSGDPLGAASGGPFSAQMRPPRRGVTWHGGCTCPVQACGQDCASGGWRDGGSAFDEKGKLMEEVAVALLA